MVTVDNVSAYTAYTRGRIHKAHMMQP